MSIRKAWATARCAALTRLQLRDPGHEAGSRFDEAGIPTNYVSKRDPIPVQWFKTFTSDRLRLADWLTACGVMSVAMECWRMILRAAIRELKAERGGEIEVAGPGLAHSLTEFALIDEYRIYLHPVVLGHGKPYFAGPGRRSAL